MDLGRAEGTIAGTKGMLTLGRPGRSPPPLRIFQRFRLVKLIEKFKTRVKNLKIEKIIAFDKDLHELFFAFDFHLSKKKNNFLR